ncbi:MAG: YARHG domain-containing protein [Candidatus Kapaibacteriota bacterium]
MKQQDKRRLIVRSNQHIIRLALLLVALVITPFLLIAQSKNNAPKKTMPPFFDKKTGLHFNALANRFIEDGRTISWMPFPEEELAYLSAWELRLLVNHLYARHGARFANDSLTTYFKQFPWYEPRITSSEVPLNDVEKSNIYLINAIKNCLAIRFDAGSSESEYMRNLHGCWQEGTSTVASGYRERFSFNQSDKSFAFNANQVAESVYRKKLGYSGRFNLITGNKIELEIYAKDFVRKVPGGTYKDPKTGKNVTRTGLKIFTEDLGKEHEYKTLSMSDISVVAVEENLTKMFVKIDGLVYWRINTDPGGCE